MAPLLHSRPLTESDANIYVERDADARIRRAVASEENVLVSTVRGAGATSLLYRLEAELPDVVLVNGDRATDAADVVGSIVAQLQLGPALPELTGLLRRPDPLAAPPAFRQLRKVLAELERHPVVLVDGPLEPKLAFELFGRWRDELFALPLTWVVVAHRDRLREYLTPPADVFFDVVVDLEVFDRVQALDALERRETRAVLTGPALEAVLDGFDGTPRHLLRLARGQLALDPADALRRARAHAAATEELSRGARALLAEMQGRGPMAATDEPLRHRLGVTDRQLRRNFTELEGAGLVEAVLGASPGPGRPPLTYRLTSLGQIEPGA